ncbi:hypothetical protein WR25_24802 [Diploscapter pachys]|uniref:Uncharacterized protein n=1 Tax=Diploscapter pachys TaxID=2018661 RepID=A0A2A2K4D8_9BILA|nr:hypothetical protein WR25_24802 [Diploscapter pachys]
MFCACSILGLLEAGDSSGCGLRGDFDGRAASEHAVADHAQADHLVGAIDFHRDLGTAEARRQAHVVFALLEACAVEVSSLMIGNDNGVITRLSWIGSGSGMRIESRAGARPVCTTISTSLSPALALFLSSSSSAWSSSGVFGRSSAALR